MELRASIIPYIWPTVVFLDRLPDQVNESLADVHDNPQRVWATSVLNPCNRLNADIPVGGTWQIDGCTSRGTQFFAVPIDAETRKTAPIRRIDVFIPDQSRLAPVMRKQLRALEAANSQGPAASRLPLADYLRSVLSRWRSGFEGFDDLYRALPFGTRIIIESLPPSPENAKPRFYLAPSVQEALLSVSTLQAMWPHLDLPREIDVDQLEFVSQLHESVSIVRIPQPNVQRLWVFKSRTREQKYLYHELKMLLSLPRRANIIPSPEYIVTRESDVSASPLVLGILSPYHPLGTLADMIQRHRAEAVRHLPTQLGWAKQLCDALMWLATTPMRYYSELKPNNVVCVSPTSIILIDMEQSGNWQTFTAPEIHHVENLARLANSPLVPTEEKRRFEGMLKQHIPMVAEVHDSARYGNPETGYFDAWNLLSSERQEAAMVFSLGKMMWCIFERWSHTVNGVEEEYTGPCGWEFPEFRESQSELRELVAACTKGSPDWVSPATARLERVGTKAYPRGLTGQHGEREASPLETLQFSRNMWQDRLLLMDRYFNAMMRWESGVREGNDESLLGYPQRPTLRAVMSCLEKV